MSDSNSMWPFQEISAEEGLDINEIFGTGTSSGAATPEANPFQVSFHGSYIFSPAAPYRKRHRKRRQEARQACCSPILSAAAAETVW